MLWIGKDLIEGSRDTVDGLERLGKKIYFITNMAAKSRSQIHQDAKHHGYTITEDKILSASYAVAKYLFDRKFSKKVYLIGQSGTAMELKNLGIDYIDSNSNVNAYTNISEIVSNGIELDQEVGAVIVCFDDKFNYVKLLYACNYLKNPECLFIGSSLDDVYPTNNDTVIPATAPIIRAIECGCKRQATIVGKPFRSICESLIDQGHLIPARTLVIGDSAKFDILFGTNCGFQTMLVGTGVNSMGDVRKWQQSDNFEDKKLIPDVYLPKLGDLLTFL